MKVALLTFHNALNYGAALQVYACQQAIASLGVDCEVIDYVNDFRGMAYDTAKQARMELVNGNYRSALKYTLGTPFMRKRRKEFMDFYRRFLRCTGERYTSSEELSKLNSVYDKFIVGSDQVWNFHHNGNDFAYFLDFVQDDAKKVSYSSSFGLAEIPNQLEEKHAHYLDKITYLSTREEYGVQLIRDLVAREAELVLDPVFLLDRSHWERLCGGRRSSGQYVFSYTNRESQWQDFLKITGFAPKGLQVHKLTRHLTIRDFVDPGVRVSYSISPVEFIRRIANAELVVSASFHCISMAIIMNVPFVAILTGDKGKDERVLNILRISGLENRILRDGMTAADVGQGIEYKRVEERVSAYIYSSREFLRRAILA